MTTLTLNLELLHQPQHPWYQLVVKIKLQYLLKQK